MRFLRLIFMCVFALCSAAHAQSSQPKRYASIVVDADTHEIIHARAINDARFPASLTKVMTLYLTFDALNAGTLDINEPLKVSRNAASTPPFGLGLRRGQTITVDQAIQALTVNSANDVAVVLAERLAGSEAAFAAAMTAKAHALNMQRTTFMTPHGLPNPQQVTTARDMAKLASAILTNHRRYYHYFGQTHFTWKGRTQRNTNSLLHWLSGVDGFKTGFTNASGYNLIISAERSGRRIIAVVLGGASGRSRDRHMQDLIEKSFTVIGVEPVTSRPPINVAKLTEPKPKAKTLNASVPQVLRLRGRNEEIVTIRKGVPNIEIASVGYDTSWSIQTGAFASRPAAEAHLAAIAQQSGLNAIDSQPEVMPHARGEDILFRARFTGLTAAQAQEACKTLKSVQQDCRVIAPSRG